MPAQRSRVTWFAADLCGFAGILNIKEFLLMSTYKFAYTIGTFYAVTLDYFKTLYELYISDHKQAKNTAKARQSIILNEYTPNFLSFQLTEDEKQIWVPNIKHKQQKTFLCPVYYYLSKCHWQAHTIIITTDNLKGYRKNPPCDHYK